MLSEQHSSSEALTARFYDDYWPANIPRLQKTPEHVSSLLPPGRFERALDAGCGTGVCSLTLADRCDQVVGVDTSEGSLATAVSLAHCQHKDNLSFHRATLLDLPFDDVSFDLTWSWGVVHHTVDPRRALDELVRVLKPGGYLILAVYLRTALTPVHELARRICLRMPGWQRKAFIRSATSAIRLAATLLGRSPGPRDDTTLASQVEDWFFVPEKHFFSIEELQNLFQARGLSFELLHPATGRFKSSSNFIVRGKKN